MTPIEYLKQLITNDLFYRRRDLDIQKEELSKYNHHDDEDKEFLKDSQKHLDEIKENISNGEYLLSTVKFLENGWSIESLGSGGFIYSKPVKPISNDKPLGIRQKSWVDKIGDFINGR